MHVEVRFSFFWGGVYPLNEEVDCLFICAGLQDLQPCLDLLNGKVRCRRGFLELGNLRLDGLHLFANVSHYSGRQGPCGQILHKGVIFPLLRLYALLEGLVEVLDPVFLPGLILAQGGGDLVLILWRQELVKVVHSGLVYFLHTD